MRSLRAIGFALAILLVPAALAADQGAVTFGSGFASMTMTLDMDATGEDAAEMRMSIDQYGNQDGQATQEEADKFARDFKSLIGSGMVGIVEGGNMTFDGKLPTGTELAEFALNSAAGPVTSTDRIGMHAVIRMTLHPAASATHTLFMRGESEEGEGTIQMTFTAPAGFVVDSFTGMPGAVRSSDMTTLTFTDSAGNDQDSTIVFGPKPAGAAGSKPSPVLPLPLMLGVLLLTGLAIRPRRAD